MKNYITETYLRDYYAKIFKLKLMLHYEIYSKITPYVVQNKDRQGKIKNITEISIMNKILITRDTDFNNLAEVSTKIINFEGLPTQLDTFWSKVIIIINDDYNPVNIKSQEIKWYTVIDREVKENYTEIYNQYNFLIPSTLYCSMSLTKLMSILSNNKVTNEVGKSKIKIFLEQELIKGINIDFYFKNNVKEYLNTQNKYLDKNYELELWRKFEYKLSKNKISQGYRIEPRTTFHKFDLDNVLITYKNIFWQNILYLINIYNIKIWKGKEKGINFNICSLFTMVHNALVTKSESEKIVLMNKIVQLNENLKTCKEILDDNLYQKIITLLNKIDELITTNTSIERYLNEIVEVVNEKHDKFNVINKEIIIYGEKLKEINYNIIEDHKILSDKNDSDETNKWEKRFINYNLDENNIKPEAIEKMNEKMITNYQINYFLSNILLLEMLLKNLYDVLNKTNIKYNYQLKNSSFFYIFFKLIFNYLYYCVLYYEYIQSKGKNYSINLIKFPDNYINILDYIGKEILKTINGSGCYCENEIKIDNDNSTLKFNLLISDLEIKLDLLKIFNSIENKICNSEQKLNCKVSKNVVLENYNTNKENKSKVEINLNLLPEELKNKLILHRKINGKQERKYHTSTRTNNKIIEMKESDFIEKENKEKNYNNSLFNILEKIKHLTSTPYNPKEVQQLIEDHWTYLIKESYKGNIHKHIEILNPKLYEVFLFRNMKSIKKVFNTIYIYFNDIRIYLITYNVITQYFRRASTTTISKLITDHILLHIYKNYLIPRLFLESKNNKDIPREFQDKFLIDKFKNKYNSFEFYDLLEFLDKESLDSSSVHIDNLIKTLSLRLFDDENYLKLNPNKIKFNDFVEEVCYYSSNKKINIKDKYELDFEISKFKLHLGEWLISSFEEKKVLNLGWKLGSRNINILDLNEKEQIDLIKFSDNKTEENLIEFNHNIINKNINKINHILASNLPMICEPNKWSDNQFGGFLNNEYLEKPLITGIGINNSHEIKNLENLYKAINNSSSIKFSVNSETLDFILNNKNKLLKDYYEGSDLSEIKDNILRDIVSLEVAKTYRNIPFYLNTYADWRGRIYHHSFYLGYQSSDFSLSLINFYEGEILNERGLNYLCIYGANLYDENNISKEPYWKRIQWVLNNEIKILNMDIDFILKADSRFTFISFCLAYKNYKNNEKVYLPISLDSTASAIQVFSALLLDEELAKSVNVIPNNIDRVSDIYTEMLEPINENITNFVKDNPEYKNLGLIKLKRKNVKTPLMTVTYNSTGHGRSLQLASTFKKVKIDDIKILDPNVLSTINHLNNKPINFNDDNEESIFNLKSQSNNIVENIYNESIFNLENNKINESENEIINYDHLKYLYEVPSKDSNKVIYLTFKEIFKLAQLMHECLFNSYPNLRLIFDYLNSISKAFSLLDIPISWSPPSGLLISQKYLKVKKVRVSISVGKGKKKTVILSQKLNEMDNRAQVLALNPNIIHSLDASLVIILLSKYSNNMKPLVTIHDCFITHSNNMLNLVEILQDEFINLFEKENFIEKFNNDLLTILDNHKVNYKIDKNKVSLQIKKSLYSDLPIINKFNIPLKEIKQKLESNKSLTRDQLILNSYQKNKLKDLSFLLPPKPGKLNLKEIKNSSYIIT